MARTNGLVQNFDLLAEGVGEIAVAGETVVWTYIFACPKDVSFGFEFKFKSDGDVRANIEIEQGNTPPTTEATTDSNMVVPDGAGYLLESIADENVHVVAYAPVVTNFLRAKITGTVGNDASTVLERFVINTIVNS